MSGDAQKGHPIVGFLLLGVIGVIAFTMCSTEAEPGSDVPFSGKVTGFTPLDEANLSVSFTLTNEGDEAAQGGCSIRAMDASGIVGFDVFTSRRNIAPGETATLRGSIRIEDEGAFRVRRVVAKDCEAE